MAKVLYFEFGISLGLPCLVMVSEWWRTQTTQVAQPTIMTKISIYLMNHEGHHKHSEGSLSSLVDPSLMQL